jgi:hypothetical protein
MNLIPHFAIGISVTRKTECERPVFISSQNKEKRREQCPLPLPSGAAICGELPLLTAIRTGPSDSLRKYGLHGADRLTWKAISKCEKTHTGRVKIRLPE